MSARCEHCSLSEAISSGSGGRGGLTAETTGRNFAEHFVANVGACADLVENGIPNSITEWASPQQVENRMRLNLGAFVQDKWAIHRLSLNYGLRFDYFNAYVPAQTRPGGFFVPALSFSEIDHVGDFKDITPRLGAAYDLSGNGKTAIKA